MPTATIKAREEARAEATRALIRLRVDLSQPVDIFKVIQDEGIWLMFQPLKNLLGVYMPQGEAAGIIIHSRHPLSLQRFTAAHEFGHYVLQHPLTFDDEGTIKRGGSSVDMREVAADAFAANFLMPLQLVNSMLIRMGLPRDPDQLTALQVYQLSLDMGVSYAATVNHLALLKKISLGLAEQLREQRPKSIKTQIAGTPLENSWADIWVLDEKNSGKRIPLRVYDELRISLPESPSTGYIWTTEDTGVVGTSGANMASTSQPSLFDNLSKDRDAATPAPVVLVSNEFELNVAANSPGRLGAAGNRYLTFRSMRPGSYTLRLLRRRPWQTTSPPAEIFEVHLDVSPKISGFSAQQQQALLNAV